MGGPPARGAGSPKPAAKRSHLRSASPEHRGNTVTGRFCGIRQPLQVVAIREMKHARLVLTSSGLTSEAGSHFARLLKLAAAETPSKEAKVVYIPDAAAAEGAGPDGMYRRMQSELKHLGASSVVCLPLATADRAQVAAELEGAACVYVEMGNTYFVTYQ
ncbi:hypothetical protein CYMTET_44566, partial [Cymbomonas tetramitiformis]